MSNESSRPSIPIEQRNVPNLQELRREGQGPKVDDVLNRWMKEHCNNTDSALSDSQEAGMMNTAMQGLKEKTGREYFEIKLLTPAQFEDLKQTLERKAKIWDDVPYFKVPFRSDQGKLDFLYAVGLRPIE